MRFPFTFMGVTALVFGAWILGYLLLHTPDPVDGGLEFATALVLVAFGSWLLWRRITRGREA